VWGQQRSHCKGRARALPNFGVPFRPIKTYSLWRRSTKFSMVTYTVGVVFRGSTMLPQEGCWTPLLPDFWGFRLIYAYTLWCSTTKFDMVPHIKRGLFLGVRHASLRGAAPTLTNAPQFWEVLLHLCPRPLINAERPNSAWQHIWGGARFRLSATHSIRRRRGSIADPNVAGSALLLRTRFDLGRPNSAS